MSDEYEFEYTEDGDTVIRSEEDLDELFRQMRDQPWYVHLWSAILRNADEYLSPEMIYKRFVKWPYQRLTRGFDDRELWSLYNTISEFVLPRLKAYKKTTHFYGYPAELEDGNTKNPDEVWDNMLDEMIWAHEFVAANNGMDMPDYPWDDKERRDSWENRYEAGMALYTKYYRGIWQ